MSAAEPRQHRSAILFEEQSGLSAELPIREGSTGPGVIDVQQLYRETGYFTFDPGYKATASCESALTFIDGEKGILLYRGYPIEEVAAEAEFLEVCHLFLHGELPNAEEKAAFERIITQHTMVHEKLRQFYEGFRRDAQGNLLPPEIAVAQGDVDLSVIEPAAGPSCLADAEQVARPYLEDEVAADWNHYLMGTIPFADAAARPADDDLAPILACLEELSDNGAFYFRVIGHTDARGTPSLNQRLSLERAQAVRDIVAAKVPVQPWRLMAQGRGPDFPIADNDTPEGQAMNRRVEIFAIETRL